jgi:glycerol kinase
VEEIEALAEMVDDNGGVYIVPAFTGLGSPHWDMEVRGAIFGITRGTNKGHISRAILESTAYQTKDVLDRMINSTNINIPRLRVDGGGTNNDLLMRIQAEVLDLSIEVCSITETTALGAGYLAGLGIGLWNTYDQITELWESSSCFMPSQSSRLRDVFYTNWQKAVASARGWRPL